MTHARVPATFFVNTQDLDREHEAWHDEVEFALLGPHALPVAMDLPTSGGPLRAATADAAARLDALRTVHGVLFRASATERARVLDALFTWANLERPVRADRRLMTADEIRSLSRLPGCDVGSHSVSHLALPFHGGDVQREELRRSKESLEALLGRPVAAFAYPFGEYDSAVVDEARDAAYLLAVTVHRGIVTSDSNPMLLPRVEASNASSEELAAILNGLFSWPPPWRGRGSSSDVWSENEAASRKEVAAGAVHLRSRPQFGDRSILRPAATPGA